MGGSSPRICEEESDLLCQPSSEAVAFNVEIVGRLEIQPGPDVVEAHLRAVSELGKASADALRTRSGTSGRSRSARRDLPRDRPGTRCACSHSAGLQRKLTVTSLAAYFAAGLSRRFSSATAIGYSTKVRLPLSFTHRKCVIAASRRPASASSKPM